MLVDIADILRARARRARLWRDSLSPQQRLRLDLDGAGFEARFSGKVWRPGVYVVPRGARHELNGIADLDAAGSLSRSPGRPIGFSGACDHPDDLLEATVLEADPRPFVVFLTPVGRDEPLARVWRWDRHAPYLGGRRIQAAVLAEEPDIDRVLEYRVLPLKVAVRQRRGEPPRVAPPASLLPEALSA